VIERASEIVICVGSGGVGKTSVASMLGMHYAQKGKKTLLITIDPAQRLLDALALKNSEGEPIRVPLSEVHGELYAFLPDLKKEWMDFLKASIPEQDKLHGISANHFYRYMAEGFAGSLEIIVCHILYRLIHARHYDVIVLDTPPSTHSLSFFEVPEKLSKVLELNVFQLLMRNRNSLFFRLSRKLAFFGSSILYKTLEKMVGSHFLSELIDFALSIDALYEPLYQRAQAMQHLLRDKNTAWVLVLRPTLRSVEDSILFRDALRDKGIRLSQLIINQAMPSFALTQSSDAAINEIISRYERQKAYECALIEQVKSSFPGVPCYLLPLSLEEENHTKIVQEMLSNYNRFF